MVIKLTKKHALAALALIGAFVLAGGAWYFLKPQLVGAGESGRPVADPQVYKYLSLEKVIVMLRSAPGEPMSHYLAVDLVFKAPHQHEKTTKEHLAMLRSVAVRALSEYTFEAASMMTIDQFTAGINRAFSESYARDLQEKPFTEVMIGKLIIE